MPGEAVNDPALGRRMVVLGVDAGGAKSTAHVADSAGTVLAVRQGAAAHPSAGGYDGAARNLFQLISKCCSDVRCTPDELGAAVVGVTGLERETDRSRLGDLIAMHFTKSGVHPPYLTVETAARITLEGAFGGKQGVVVLAGKGSVVIGKTPKGNVVTVGGWGKILGDEGSAYSIGREALVAVAQQADRLGNAGSLREAFAERFHWSSREEIISAIYHEKFDIESLAAVVIDRAAHNDIVAQRIVQHAATSLAEQATVIVMQMGIRQKVGLALSGDLIDHETVYANVLQMKLMKLLPQVEIRKPLHPPSYGAVLMALERSRAR